MCTPRGTAMLAAMTLLLASSSARAEGNRYAERYLADPKTPATIKTAIKKRLVVAGMCPFQAFAAAGDPGPYHVKPDPSRWTKDSDPVTIIKRQCANPDGSVIEIMFKNTSQFASKAPVVFRVRFVKGKAVLIDRKALGAG